MYPCSPVGQFSTHSFFHTQTVGALPFYVVHARLRLPAPSQFQCGCLCVETSRYHGLHSGHGSRSKAGVIDQRTLPHTESDLPFPAWSDGPRVAVSVKQASLPVGRARSVVAHCLMLTGSTGKREAAIERCHGPRDLAPTTG